MTRKVVGSIKREMNREISAYQGPKNTGGNKTQKTRTVSEPRSSGLGRVYREEDEDI